MASTKEARRITDIHRRRQVRLAIASDSELRRAMKLLDPTNIDGTRGAWEASVTSTLVHYRSVSSGEAVRYLQRYREAEIGSSLGPIVRPGLDVAATRSLLDRAGPQGLKRRIREGQSLWQAYQNTTNSIIAESHKVILSGGRDVVRESARANDRVIGWRRVSDGDPCTFCAMLVSRGPAYTSYAKALGKGNGDPYHNHCGCTVEEIYSDWQPTELEQRFVDAYYEAAKAADKADEPRNASTVLWRMRADGEFRDSPARRKVTAS